MENENNSKRKILVSRSVNVEYEGILAQAGLSADTTLRIEVDPESLYPDPQAVTLLWLASTNTFHGLDLFEDFREDFEQRTGERLQEIVDNWPLVFRGDFEHVSKKLFASPKPVVNRPPFSLCPRCARPLWAREGVTPLDEIKHALKVDPHPWWCPVCGQRFAYDHATKNGVDVWRIRCTAKFSARETLRDIDSMMAFDQPALQLEATKGADDGQSE